MQKINFIGKEIVIDYNWATQISYYQITGEDIDMQNLVGPKLSALYYAAIIANNPDTDITIEDLLKKAKAKDIKLLSNAVFNEMREWFEIPDFIKEKEENPKDEESEKKV